MKRKNENEQNEAGFGTFLELLSPILIPVAVVRLPMLMDTHPSQQDAGLHNTRNRMKLCRPQVTDKKFCNFQSGF